MTGSEEAPSEMALPEHNPNVILLLRVGLTTL